MTKQDSRCKSPGSLAFGLLDRDLLCLAQGTWLRPFFVPNSLVRSCYLRAPSPPRPALRWEQSAPMPKTAKILVVDPDQNAILEMAGLFRQNGWDIVAAGDAVLAQSVIRKESPNAIVLSSQLPGGGAVLVVKRIRSSIYTVGTPVVVVSKSTGARKEEFLNAGANAFIAKGNMPGLCDALRQQLGEDPQPAASAAVSTSSSSAAAAAAHSPVRSATFTSAQLPQTPTLSEPVPSPPAAVRMPLPVFAPRENIADPERLSALAESGVLDLASSKFLDGITAVSATLLRVPTVLLSVVDKDHEFFVSQVGLPEPWARARQAPLSHSFCQWVVSANEIMVVEDSRQQPVLQSNLAIHDMNVIAYAGIPVCSTEAGPPLGSFAAIDSKPRTWNEIELAHLQNLARMAEAALFLESKASAHSRLARTAAQGAIIHNAVQILRRMAPGPPRLEQAALLEIVEDHAREIARV